ncbi:TIGR00366 family protein [Paracoccus aminovorans]|uniref:TIGR00366 family protein n=1 Tax=Paracoccus aminovorans TaxID=34004 RepID=UPI00094472C9|nr:TIGR00366 family protein [Paracoccus aminovorans]
MTQWCEKWYPDAYVFVALTLVVVALGAMAIGASPHQVSVAFGEGFWSLIPFTMQMAMVAITGYVAASSPPMTRLVIPFSQTIFLWQSLLITLVLVVRSTVVAYWTAPAPGRARTARDLGIALDDAHIAAPRRERPGEWLEFSPLLTLALVALGLARIHHQAVAGRDLGAECLQSDLHPAGGWKQDAPKARILTAGPRQAMLFRSFHRPWEAAMSDDHTGKGVLHLPPGEGRRYALGRMTAVFKANENETAARYGAFS